MSFLERFFGGRASRYFRTGIQAFEAGQNGEALAWFERAMQSGTPPGDPIGHLALFYAAEAATVLGRVALEEGTPGEALQRLEPALQWNPRSPALLELAAAAYLELEALDASDACVEALLRLDPQRLGGLLLAALLCKARGDLQSLQKHVDVLRARPLSGGVPRALCRVLEAHMEDVPEIASLLQDIVSSPQVSEV